jgi:hypothetical protein
LNISDTFRIYRDTLVTIPVIILSEVSPARLRYELPKLGIAGSNPALRIFSVLKTCLLESNLLSNWHVMREIVDNQASIVDECSYIVDQERERSMVEEKLQTEIHIKSSFSPQWKSVSIMLKENDLAILNNKLQTNGFETFSEFIHAWLKGNYPEHEKNEQIEKLLVRLREKGIKHPPNR